MKTIEIKPRDAFGYEKSGSYTAFLDEKGLVVIHETTCYKSARQCTSHDATFTQEQLRQLLGGKSIKSTTLNRTAIPMGDFVQVGCSYFLRSDVEKALSLFEPDYVEVGDYEASFKDGNITISVKGSDGEDVEAVISPSEAKSLKAAFTRSKEIRKLLLEVESLENELDDLEHQEIDGYEVAIGEDSIAFGCTDVDEATLDKIIALIT